MRMHHQKKKQQRKSASISVSVQNGVTLVAEEQEGNTPEYIPGSVT